MKTINACIFAASTLLLVNCGGGDPDQSAAQGTEQETGQSTVASESCAAPKRLTQATGAECIEPAADDVAQTIPLDTAITETLTAGSSRVYKVPSDAEISLISNSGDANLFLFDNIQDIDFENPIDSDVRLCGSWWRFKEDTCTASAPDGELHALVIADTDTTYNITATTDCSVPAINQWVYRNMRDYYLYADQVPTVNPETYTDPSDLVRELRYNELDQFSGIRNRSAQTSYYEEGISFGFGHDWKYDADSNLIITYVYPDSAFGRAGIKRGDTAVSINGVSVTNLPDDRYFELTGTRDNPLTSNWEFIDAETGLSKTISATIGEYTIDTVLYSTSYTHPDYSGRVGYIVFNNFLEPSIEDLNQVINTFANRDVSDLVLDLRYNGGGRSFVGRRLSSQIGGPDLAEKVHSRFTHNSKYSQFDFEREFFAASPSLQLNRLIVLTSRSTASASERLINSLRPYMEVVTIGDTTRGKPYSSSGRNYCGKTLNAMQTQGVNAAGVSVAGGITPTCYAADDLTSEFGKSEGMFRKALGYVLYGSCDIPTLTKKRSTPVPPRTHEALLNSDAN